jgi:asparagine synthase (glutamine-hydrolysing)
MKFRRGHGKYILKKAMKGLLPERILQRKKKGFGIPLVSWLRRMPLPSHSSRFGNYLSSGLAANKWLKHSNGTADERLFCWCWLSLVNFDTHLTAG